MGMRMARLGALPRWLGALAALALAACQSTDPAPGAAPAAAPVAAPKLAVGDHWQYRITDNLRRGAVTMLDAEVVGVAGGKATLRLVYDEPTGRVEMTDEIDANGGLLVGALKQEEVRARRFPTALEMYAFPLEPGKNWRQTVDTVNPDTQLPAQILVFGTVRERAQVSVPAGSFDTVYLYRILQLDDEQFFRTRTERRDSVWFAPQVKGVAREVRDASYRLLSGGVFAEVRSENTTRELVSFRAGP